MVYSDGRHCTFMSHSRHSEEVCYGRGLDVRQGRPAGCHGFQMQVPSFAMTARTLNNGRRACKSINRDGSLSSFYFLVTSAATLADSLSVPTHCAPSTSPHHPLRCLAIASRSHRAQSNPHPRPLNPNIHLLLNHASLFNDAHDPRLPDHDLPIRVLLHEFSL